MPGYSVTGGFLLILQSSDTQFLLADDGQILWQEIADNPLPGVKLAKIVKGPGILEPAAALIQGADLKNEEESSVVDFLNAWLKKHIDTVLEPLVLLKNTENINDPAKEIASRLYEAMGILPREELENIIASLDQDGRRALRSRKVKLGPVLVFLPALNKPAAVRVRALLWSLYNDKALPPPIPQDGIVSFKVEAAEIDPVFYRIIGYPVYGPRSIRIDMLDRVICAIYDGAEGGKFQARHEMAEWLGCSIEDLYLVLEAMGHKKIFDPADKKEEEEKPEKSPSCHPEGAEATEGSQDDSAKEQEKPQLATFRLKKGKAFEKQQERIKEKRPANSKSKPKGKKPHKKDGSKKEQKGKEKKDQGPKVVLSVESKPEDSPFAILEQLKKKTGGS